MQDLLLGYILCLRTFFNLLTNFMYYLQTDFEFSTKTKNQIQKKFAHFFTKSFEHDAEYKTLKFVSEITPLGKELKDYLKKFNLNFNYAGINAFISNTKIYTKTSPHVDVLHRNNTFLPIRSRFNVMILGNRTDPMIWWKNFTFNNPNHIEKTFNYFGHEYRSLSVPGDNIQERLNYLGTPTFVKNNLLCSSAFVNTSIAHALEISPIPRLVISVPFDKNLEDYSYT